MGTKIQRSFNYKQDMIHSRAVIVRADREQLTWIGLRRPLRVGSKTEFNVGDAAKVHMMGPRIREMRWRGVFRVSVSLAKKRRDGSRLDRRGGDSGGQPPSVEMVTFPLIDHGADLWGQQKQLSIHNDAENECLGMVWNRLANKAGDAGALEAVQAMGDGAETRVINEKEDEILADIDLSRIDPRFFFATWAGA